ncbi:hypothetical protein CfE428DRAFT_5651 [Chthoniobacter flavus Ellin428]|uniref:Uncharacterized protein n=1 Tax=Chthoniobacter flavus Ellin428 TaxID=497964 RepID=B4D9R1_9BACT|nr:hypothetical protein [Chthoniobacter flavus]EDY16842.1 hypothetical protein CfE428DRAFT_5651 [Chthoniobacter flavus Ellin428]TCO93335.1 hypothetical protein EV701_10437 [Chthoniobacter flavus]
MKFLPILLALFLTAPLLHAQKQGGGAGRNNQNQNQNNTPSATPSATPTPTNIPMWRCNLPGGSYSVALRAIVSVSSHEYLVDGIARVTEVNIDTVGNALARFYYIEPSTPNSPIGLGQATIDKAQQMLQDGAARTGQDVWQKVVKNYPTTTHAHTIEYRVADKDTLSKLYTSAESSLRLNRNAVFDGTNTTQTDPTQTPNPNIPSN